VTFTPNSKFTFTASAVIVGVAALVGVGWRAANAIRDVRDEVRDVRTEVKGLRDDVKNISAERWTYRDMERWAMMLERGNRDKIVVPDPREVRLLP
jgi:hypothetical protein